jgi:hypothetical protein
MVAALMFSSFLIRPTFAQPNKTPTVEDCKAAWQKGIITKPTPQVIKWCETGPFSPLYFPVKDEIIWFKYKGLFYSTLFTSEGTDVVVIAPNGDYVTYFFITN